MAAVTPEQLAAALSSTDAEAVQLSTLAARAQAAEPTEILVTVYDKFWKPVGESHDYIELAATRPRNQVPVLDMKLKGADPLVPLLRKCRTEVVGITVEIGAVRWAYTVEEATYKLDQGQRTLQVKALGLFDYLSYLLLWPNFLLPIQAQIPSRAVYIAPLCTCIEVMIAEQAFRMQSGLWELVNNLGSLSVDWRSWFGTVLQSRGNLLDMLHTPVYVVHTNPLFDTSPLVAITARMEPVATVIDKLVKSYGVTVDVDLWLPGDPQPDAWSRLSVPTYVVRVTDRSNLTGPTGTILDSIVKQVVNLEESVLGGVLAPFLNPQGVYAPDGVYIAPRVGVGFVAPWTLLIDHPRGPIENFEIVDHHPQGWQIIVGGKCVRGDTVIDGPDGSRRIDHLAQSGRPFRVWSLTPQGERVAATAREAFWKGRAEVFRYTLADGRYIDATQQHRFLTGKGFVSGSAISVGARIATVDHAALTSFDQPPVALVIDEDYECLEETAALIYAEVVSIQSVGVEDFYDLDVPGWQNYSANGIWNHNSPKWLNDIINATTAWLLDCLMIVIGLTGVPGTLLDGIFNDVLLSFQLIENFNRRNQMGPYGRPERFLATGAAPYNVDALMSFISLMWDTRGYRSAMAQFRNGFPYSVGRDVFPGAMMSIAENGELYTDYIENIIVVDSRKERAKVFVQIGDGKAEEAPIARYQRLITGLQEAFNVLTLAPGQ